MQDTDPLLSLSAFCTQREPGPRGPSYPGPPPPYGPGAGSGYGGYPGSQQQQQGAGQQQQEGGFWSKLKNTVKIFTGRKDYHIVVCRCSCGSLRVDPGVCICVCCDRQTQMRALNLPGASAIFSRSSTAHAALPACVRLAHGWSVLLVASRPDTPYGLPPPYPGMRPSPVRPPWMAIMLPRTDACRLSTWRHSPSSTTVRHRMVVRCPPRCLLVVLRALALLVPGALLRRVAPTLACPHGHSNSNNSRSSRSSNSRWGGGAAESGWAWTHLLVCMCVGVYG